MTGRWRRSSFSGGAGECVEVAWLPEGWVGVRDSKDPDGPTLKFSAAEWRMFVDALAAEQLGTYGGPVLLVAATLNCWEMWRDGAPWLSLTFDDAEVDAFVAGVMAGEFTPEALSRSDVDALAKRCVGPEAAQESSPVSR